MVGSKMTVTDTLRRQQHGPWWCVLKHRPRLDGATNDNDAAENQTFHHEGALKKEIPPKLGGGGGVGGNKAKVPCRQAQDNIENQTRNEES